MWFYPNLNFKLSPSFWGKGLWCCVALQVGLLGYLQHQLWFAADGRVKLIQLTKQVSEQQQDNARLVLKNDLLEGQIRALRTPGPAMEGRARLDLGLIQSGETLFLLTQE